MSNSEVYRKLAQAILAHEGKIGADAAVFVKNLAAQLAAAGNKISPAIEAELAAYLEAMKTAIGTGIATASSLAISELMGPKTALALRSEKIAQLAADAYSTRWPDGLTLSDRLWRWDEGVRSGLDTVLKSGIKAGLAVDKIAYDMQYAIERSAGKPFKIVEAYQDDWVKELHEAAVDVIHNPADKAYWNKLVGEAEDRILTLKATGTRSAAERVLSQMKKAVSNGTEALADRSVKWWLYDQQLYHLKRIARTEMAQAMHSAVIASVEGDDSIIGFQWRLSASHPVADICDYYANIEMGLGKGVFTRDAVPHTKAHPHCMCLLIPRVTPIKAKGTKNYAEFIKNATPTLRETILPKWAKAAIDKGLPIDKLLRPDGFGLLSKTASNPVVSQHTGEVLIAKLAKKAKNVGSLAPLWANEETLKGHIAKRVKLGHIVDEADYFSKVRAVIAGADKFNIVNNPSFPLVELVSGDWSVIVNHDGLVKTAYLHEKNLTSFTDIQTQKGHTVYGHNLSEGFRN